MGGEHRSSGPVHAEHAALLPLIIALVAIAARSPWSWPAATVLVALALLIVYAVAVSRRRGYDG